MPTCACHVYIQAQHLMCHQDTTTLHEPMHATHCCRAACRDSAIVPHAFQFLANLLIPCIQTLTYGTTPFVSLRTNRHRRQIRRSSSYSQARGDGAIQNVFDYARVTAEASQRARPSGEHASIATCRHRRGGAKSSEASSITVYTAGTGPLASAC